MKASKFTDAQKAFIIKQAIENDPVVEKYFRSPHFSGDQVAGL